MIARLGQKPEHLKPVEYDKEAQMNLAIRPAGKPPMKLRAGVDLFIDRRDGNPDQIAGRDAALRRPGREADDDQQSRHEGLAERQSRHLLERPLVLPLRSRRRALHRASTSSSCSKAADHAGFDVIKTEGLYTFNGERGYSLAQGE